MQAGLPFPGGSIKESTGVLDEQRPVDREAQRLGHRSEGPSEGIQGPSVARNKRIIIKIRVSAANDTSNKRSGCESRRANNLNALPFVGVFASLRTRWPLRVAALRGTVSPASSRPITVMYQIP